MFEVFVCMSVFGSVVVTMDRSTMLVGMRQGRVSACAEIVDELHTHPRGSGRGSRSRLDIKSSRSFPVSQVPNEQAVNEARTSWAGRIPQFRGRDTSQ